MAHLSFEHLEKKYPNEFTNHTVVMKFIDSVALSTSELQKTLKAYCDEKYNKFHYLSSYSDKVNYIENTLGIKDLTKEQLDILCDFKDDGYLLLYLILYYLYNEYMKAHKLSGMVFEDVEGLDLEYKHIKTRKKGCISDQYMIDLDKTKALLKEIYAFLLNEIKFVTSVSAFLIFFSFLAFSCAI